MVNGSGLESAIAARIGKLQFVRVHKISPDTERGDLLWSTRQLRSPTVAPCIAERLLGYSALLRKRPMSVLTSKRCRHDGVSWYERPPTAAQIEQ